MQSNNFKFAMDVVRNHYRHWITRVQRGIYDPVPFQLNKCQAWMSGECYSPDYKVHYNVLQSYSTPVAVYIKEHNTVYRFGTWSNTTAQHQWKFYRKMNAEKMEDVGNSGLFRGWR